MSRLILEAFKRGFFLRSKLTCRKCRDTGIVYGGVLSTPFPCPKCQAPTPAPPRMGSW